jgi:hypothetical protein
VLTIAILLSSALSAGHGLSVESVTLKLMPPVGSTYRYRATARTTMTGSTTRPSSTTNVESDMTMKVTARIRGVTTIETRLSNVRIIGPVGGQTDQALRSFEKQMASAVTTSKFDSHSHLLDMDGMGLEVMAQSFTYVAFPTGPVRVGHMWNSTLDISKMSGAPGGSTPESAGGSIPIHLRLDKIERHGAKTVAELSIRIDGESQTELGGQMVNLRIDSTTDAFIDATDGMPISLKSDISSTATVGDKKVSQKHILTLKRL